MKLTRELSLGDLEALLVSGINLSGTKGSQEIVLKHTFEAESDLKRYHNKDILFELIDLAFPDKNIILCNDYDEISNSDTETVEIKLTFEYK